MACQSCVLHLLSFFGLLVSCVSGNSQTSGDLEIYIGAGCFWCVQEKLNKAEESVLGRPPENITGISGYAGGTGSADTVCYGNYGSLGHTEVVSLIIPYADLGRFLEVAMRDSFPDGERIDPVNKGAPYRSAVGFPGGAANLHVLEVFRNHSGLMMLVPGYGDEQDNLGQRKIYVYDSNNFPFYTAELYHQFHDYGGEEYSRHTQKSGRLTGGQDCPSEFMEVVTHPVTIAFLAVFGTLCCCGFFHKYWKKALCRK